MMLVVKIVAMMISGFGGTGVYWGLKDKKVYLPFGHGLPYSRQYFARQYWLGMVGYMTLLVGGAVAYVLL